MTSNPYLSLSKSVCQICGTLNTLDGEMSYPFGKDIYTLNACDSNFFLEFDNTTYTQYDSENHITTIKKGTYCQFCKGTYARAKDEEEPHNIDEIIDAQIGNQRFHITGECEDCGYIENEYAVAKSVVQSYYGPVDGEAHTITLSDLSERGVNTSIRYGESADKCVLTSAPNYTEAGYHPVYYEITYRYADESMKENGVSYVWLLEDNSNSKTQSDTAMPHVHDYRYVETVRPTCTELGYDRFQCSECGSLQKTNYTPAEGHNYQAVVIREASCQQGGLILHSCGKCGAFYTESTSTIDHKYQTTSVAATCTTNGYTEHKCINCGYKYITDLTALAKHDYREKVTQPTCTSHGFTTYTCDNCDESYVSDYTDALGHNWDNGHTVTGATCNGEGLKEYDCTRCDAKMLEAISASGHKPGKAATCTQPQTCSECGAVLEMPTGHHYTENVTAPTCTTPGFTTYTCVNCGVSYVGNYIEKTKHHYHSVITPATCTELGYTTYTCVRCGDEYKSDYTDKKPHNYQAVITPASCTKMGFTTYTCADCEDSYVADYTEVRPHNYTKQVVPPTCTSQGYTIYTCPDCGKEYIGDEKESIPHKYTSVVTEPACTEMGYTTYTCDDCEYYYVADYTNPKGHDYVETVTLPTCTDIGFSTFKCSRCDASYVGKETAKLPHNYEQAVTEPTCTQMGYTIFTCQDCNDTYTGDYTDAKGHDYVETVTPPTCTDIGFSTFECSRCDASFVGKETAKLPHDYEKAVTEPTCTQMGYTVFTCKDCNDTYTGDYTDEKGHDYVETVTPPTCTEMGFSTFKCSRCDASYVGKETAKLPHNYEKAVTEPKCTEMGYTIFTCQDCGDTYTGDYTDPKGHNYVETVTPPTCTELGYSTFTCSECGASYKGNETSEAEHEYNYVVTPPSCTELGYTTATCEICGETHIIDYVEASGHKPSEWIIEEPATIEHSGSKYKECSVCGETLETEEIPQLADKDNSDEDGHSKVGDYSILITDGDSNPIFNSEISIDTDDNITIILPDGRLLSAEDITTITVLFTETQRPAEGIRIFVVDAADNAATGETDEDGQLKVPNASSSTGDSNGTVADDENTYVVVVTDENGELIPDCAVTVGDNYSINVKLPDGTPFDRDNRVTVTVVTEKGEPVSDLRVQLIGDGDFVENGYTNIKGQITLPVTNTDITDESGSGEVGDKDGEKVYNYIVTVSDEEGFIEDALITLVAKDNSILVCLPEGKVIDYYNRTTVKVVRSDGTPVQDWKVSVYNKDGSGLRTELTDENGIVIVPPLNEAPFDKPTSPPDDEEEPTLPGVDPSLKPDNPEDPSEEDPSEPVQPTPDESDGAVVQNKNYKYRVFVWDNYGVITEFGIIKLTDDGNLEIKLPKNKTLDPNNKVNIKVINENDGTPVKGITVNVTDKNGGAASDITNSAGIAIVPVSDTDVTDANGNSQVKDAEGNFYNVNVRTELKGNIEGAKVEIAKGIITVTLPDGTVIDYADRTIVTVTDKDNSPVSDMPVNVKDGKGGSRTEKTDKNGVVVVPPLSEDKTDDKGNSDVTETKPGEDEDTDGDGKPDTPGEDVVNTYKVLVENNDGIISNAFIEIQDSKITVTLPNGYTLTTSNQTTVTVTDNNDKPVKGMSVTVKDTITSKNGTTNSRGQVTLPVKTSGGGGGSSSGGGSHGGNVTVTTTYNVEVTDKDGKSVTVTKSVKDGKITLNLPNGKTLDGGDYYTIVVTDMNGRAASDIDVTLTDKNGKTANGVTDASGKLVLPAKEHKSYIVGYDDGTFKSEGNMTRAEAAVIFARNIAERKGENIKNSKSKFIDRYCIR